MAQRRYNVLRVERLTASRGDEKLENVSLTVAAGEIVAMVGRGAALLMDLCTRERWLRPDSGWVRYAGEDKGTTPAGVRAGRVRPKYLLPETVAVVDIRVPIIPAPSGDEYVARVLNWKGRPVDYDDIERIAADAKLDDLLDMATYDIASAADLHLLDLWANVAVRPQVLLIRDPFPRRMADPSYRDRWYALLAVAAARSVGILLLSSTDRFDHLADYYDRVIGLIFAEGTYTKDWPPSR